jgi:hypothetical protein
MKFIFLFIILTTHLFAEEIFKSCQGTYVFVNPQKPIFNIGCKNNNDKIIANGFVPTNTSVNKMEIEIINPITSASRVIVLNAEDLKGLDLNSISNPYDTPSLMKKIDLKSYEQFNVKSFIPGADVKFFEDYEMKEEIKIETMINEKKGPNILCTWEGQSPRIVTVKNFCTRKICAGSIKCFSNSSGEETNEVACLSKIDGSCPSANDCLEDSNVSVEIPEKIKASSNLNETRTTEGK